MTTSECPICAANDPRPMFEREGHQFVRCASCGLERIFPQPTDATLGEIYGAHYYDSWNLHGNEAAVGRLKKRTFGYVLGRLPAPRSGSKLLDCGAATGFLLEVAQERGYDPYGLELSEFGAAEIARKFGRDHSFHGQMEDASFPTARPGDFDVITMCDYIEHVRDPGTTLRQARALLGKDGALVLTTPDAGSLSHRVFGTGWPHYKVEHLFYFDRANLRRLLRDAGFATVSTHLMPKALTIEYVAQQFDNYPHPVMSKLARAVRAVTPSRLQQLPIPLLTGDLLVVARA